MLEKYGVRRYAQTTEFHNKSQHKYKFNDEVFDSFPELAFYIYCIDYNLNIKHIPVKIKYYFNNEIHYYFPDFELDGQLVEIKGDHFFNKDGTMQCPFDHTQDALFEAKHQCMLANNIKIYRSKDYQFAIDYFNQKYKKENFKI